MKIARGWYLIGIVGLGACDQARKDAEKAIDLADRVVTKVLERATKVVPDEAKALTDSLAAAKALEAAGKHDAAKAAANGVSERAMAVFKSLSGKSTEISSSFMSFSAELPEAVKQIEQRIEQLSGGGKLPPGVDRAKLAALKEEVTGWRDKWKAAVADFNKGELGPAGTTVVALKQRVVEIKTLLAIPPAK